MLEREYYGKQMQSFIMNSHEVFIHIHQGCFAGTGAIVRLPQCQWSKPDGYGKISQCITTTKHSKAKTVCIFLGIYCMSMEYEWLNESITYMRDDNITIVHLFLTMSIFNRQCHRYNSWQISANILHPYKNSSPSAEWPIQGDKCQDTCNESSKLSTTSCPYTGFYFLLRCPILM